MADNMNTYLLTLLERMLHKRVSGGIRALEHRELRGKLVLVGC